jgi:hypothetical protein
MHKRNGATNDQEYKGHIKYNSKGNTSWEGLVTTKYCPDRGSD